MGLDEGFAEVVMEVEVGTSVVVAGYVDGSVEVEEAEDVVCSVDAESVAGFVLMLVLVFVSRSSSCNA